METINTENPKIQKDIIDLDLSSTSRKSIRIDGDDNRILMLNLSDMSIIVRLKESYPKMVEKVSKLSSEIAVNTENEEDLSLDNAADILSEMDLELRSYMDYIFDSNVCEVCVPEGSLYDPFNGKFRFEIILEQLISLYTNNVALEYRKMSARIHKHVDKYTGKSHK